MDHNNCGWCNNSPRSQLNCQVQKRPVCCSIYVELDEKYQFEAKYREDSNDIKYVWIIQWKIRGVTQIFENWEAHDYCCQRLNGNRIWLWNCGARWSFGQDENGDTCKTYQSLWFDLYGQAKHKIVKWDKSLIEPKSCVPLFQIEVKAKNINNQS